MADWRKLARELLLADGRIDEREAALIRKELFADGRIDTIELEFLLELKKGAASVPASYNRMLFDAIKNHLLADGTIHADDATWLRTWIFADGKVDAEEKNLLQELKSGAQHVSPEFEALYDQCMVS
jgi:hypothetical protein